MLWHDEMNKGCYIVKKALLVIDYTMDFVAEDGALTCGQPGIDLENIL